MSFSGPLAPLPSDPFWNWLSELPFWLFSPSGLPGPGAFTAAAFFDEHPAIARMAQSITATLAPTIPRELLTQPPRPRWTRVIAFTLRQWTNDFLVGNHQNIDS